LIFKVAGLVTLSKLPHQFDMAALYLIVTLSSENASRFWKIIIEHILLPSDSAGNPTIIKSNEQERAKYASYFRLQKVATAERLESGGPQLYMSASSKPSAPPKSMHITAYHYSES
jgi:hypothetical protein